MILALIFIGGCGSVSKEAPASLDGLGNGGASAANSRPTISGSPPTAVLIGTVYSFTPTAHDADGDALTFTVQNLPRWASFDTLTGRLSGQPLLGDVGTYGSVRISVSDGGTSSALPEFSITVTDTALGSMTLTWTPPTENTDGTALTNLAGYKLYYGLSQSNYPYWVRIDNPSISTYIIENLLPDTYYVVATSFNTLGVESSYSNVAVKIVESQ